MNLAQYKQVMKASATAYKAAMAADAGLFRKPRPVKAKPPEPKKQRPAEPHQRILNIQQAVAAKHGLTASDLAGRDLGRMIARARAVAVHLCRQLTPHSWTTLCRHFGNRDRATMIAYVSRAAHLEKTDPAIAEAVRELRERLAA